MTGPGNTLADFPFLESLSDSARSALEQRARWVRYTTNDTIIDRETESRDVYFIVEGRVRVVNFSISGREITFDEMEPGGVFGELAALDGMPRSAAVVALTDTLVASISPDTFLNLLRDHPDLAIGVMQELAKIVRTSTERIMDLSTLGAHNRVHSEILREARAHAEEDANTARISPIPVHADIAARVSTTRETVARVLSDLTRQGLLKREKDALAILDLERLEDLVEEVRDF
tara:strand:+ start:23012 stop:23710 length:699 start_codon:yes stop_codon:yes gene_type:complete